MSALEGFVSAVAAPQGSSPAETWAYAFSKRRLLVHVDGETTRVPTLEELAAAARDEALRLVPVRRQFLGTLGGHGVASLELRGDAEAPAGMAFQGLRELFPRLGESQFQLAARAVQIVDWDRDHQFCGRCGGATEEDLGERSRRCPRCELIHYPRLSPAVIVLVERGDEVLLARSPHFLPGMYSTLAGFVEPGETLERTVAREIEEEVGVRVRNVRYFGSQPWPFPNSLMVGFRADYAGGEIAIDGEEIEDAAWFRCDALPRIPPRISIARALIEAYLAERRG